MQQHTQHSMVEQTINNATSWIGHRHYDNSQVAAGQTFYVTTEGDLESIEIFSTIVIQPGSVVMTLYDFDEQKNEWGASLGSANVNFTKESHGQWIPFFIKNLHLRKGKTYAFKLESADTYIGVGEAAGSAHHPPMNAGKEWRFTNNQQPPHGFRYFSLAFKIGLKAA